MSGSVSREKLFEIVGQGLAGCCLSWQLGWKHKGFRAFDDGLPWASSRVAGGLVNPVTGRNFEPSWRIAEFLPESIRFFERVEAELGRKFWHPLPVLRLVGEKDWSKVASKLEQEKVAIWVDRVDESLDDWRAGVWLQGGGRLDVKGFCDATAERFRGQDPDGEVGESVNCGGATDLIAGKLGEHRCAKGEILTIRWSGKGDRIVVGGGGWLVPLGGGLFKAGSTYEWDQLDGGPTLAGRIRVEEMLERLGVQDFEVVAHEAGVRPIVRRSKPLIGRTPAGEVVFNGLGSKGSLYAPGAARRLAEWLTEGKEIDETLDVGKWLAGKA
ncbi:MAG: FAD-dependent oxidoreductase [Verrucomicrobiota bacterium]